MSCLTCRNQTGLRAHDNLIKSISNKQEHEIRAYGDKECRQGKIKKTANIKSLKNSRDITNTVVANYLKVWRAQRRWKNI